MTRKNPGLAIILLLASGRIYEGLKVSASIHPIVYRDYHRVLSRVFPYGFFYTMDDEGAVVWAEVDLRRDPDWIREAVQMSRTKQS